MYTPNIKQMTPGYLGSSRYDLIIQVFRKNVATHGKLLYQVLRRRPAGSTDPVLVVRQALESAGFFSPEINGGLDLRVATPAGEEHRNMLSVLYMLGYWCTRNLLFNRYSKQNLAVCDVLNDLTTVAKIIPAGNSPHDYLRVAIPPLPASESESESEPLSEPKTENEMSPNISAEFSVQTLIGSLRQRVETTKQMINDARTRNGRVIDEIGTRIASFLTNLKLDGRVEMKEPNGNPVIVLAEPTVDHETKIGVDENSLRQLEALAGTSVSLSTGEVAQLLAPPEPVASRKYRVTLVLEPV